jgi:DNA-3-methyladenine glycosylase I
MSYCTFCEGLSVENLNKIYPDTAYGFPIEDDSELFGRLILEINQAGLSWELMLKKEENFRKAFDNFNLEKIALYDDVKISELLQDSGIIRNQLKIRSVIFNAAKVVELKKEFGSFKNWLNSHHPLSLAEWVKLFKKNFKFVGGEIVNEFLMSTSYLKGAHDENCTVFVNMNKETLKWKI